MSGVENGAALIAYTVPSRFVVEGVVEYENPEFDYDISTSTKEPYRRVVGLADTSGETVWTPTTLPFNHYNFDPDHAFDPADAEPETLPLDEHDSKLVLGAFRRFLGEEARAERPADFYSCATLAKEALGLDDSDNTVLDEAIQAGRQVESLASGQIGVIGYLDGGEKPFFQHAVMGLGKNNPDCLQIMWTKGHMGIASYDSMLRFYKRQAGGIFRTLRAVTHLGLYAVEVPVVEMRSEPAEMPASLVA